MQASHTRAGVSARFDDQSVVSHAGLLPLLRLTENVGFADLATERIRIPGPAGANPDAKLLSLVAGMAAGADSIDDLDLLRHGGMPELFGGVYAALVDRCVAGFRSLQPTYCSIYHPDFWLQERLWKTADDSYLKVFDGTPFKSLIWQLMGVRIGRRVFDDGVHISERTLTTIGDGCTLNAGSTIQCHSQEDGTFKRDKTTLGAGCTVGVGALVHYGVTMGDGSVLAADSFLMKGEDVPAHARWGGNPAREL